MASKYAPLGEYLSAQQSAEAPMTFSDIEKVIGTNLPPRAQNHPAWWSNSTTNNTMTRFWLGAGFKTERVDVASRRLVFRRVDRPVGVQETASAFAGPDRREAAASNLGLLDRIRERLGGTVKVADGVDLTEPTGAVWDAERD